jgi:hypothetical protein
MKFAEGKKFENEWIIMRVVTNSASSCQLTMSGTANEDASIFSHHARMKEDKAPIQMFDFTLTSLWQYGEFRKHD